MSTVRESIEVAVPARVAYDRLCHLEDYSQFMSGVTDSTRLSDTTAHMVMDLEGNRAEFDACITEQRPGELVSWKATDGPEVCETVRLEALSASATRIIAELQIDAERLMPSEAHAQEVLDRRLKADLRGFKKYVEQRVLPRRAMAQPPSASPAKSPPGMVQSPSSHVANERPMQAIPPTGNLGPLHNVQGRAQQPRRGGPSRPGRANGHSPEHGDSF